MAVLATVAITSLSSVACTRIPPGRTAVSGVDVQGAKEVDEDDILDKIATTPSPKFLKLWSGVMFDYELYDRFTVRRDLARVERFYRARGFYEAHARIARVEESGAHQVKVTIVVEEGAPIVVRSVTLRGIEAMPPEMQAAALAGADVHLKKGERFDEEEYEKAEARVLRALGDRGYAFAKSKHLANVDLAAHAADITFELTPDSPAKLGPITIEGMGSLPEAPVRRAMDLQEGETFSTQRLDDAQQAALDLGVFSSVDVDPQLADPPPGDHVVPVIIRVEPTPLYSVRLGFGGEFDMVRTDVHAVAQWEAKNFLGGMRTFTVREKPGVVLWPTTISNLVAPRYFLPENRLRAELRQPGFLEARTNATVRAEYNVFPLILGRSEESTAVLGYQEVIGSVGLDRTVWKATFTPSYNLQSDFPFMYVGTPQKGLLNDIVVSYLQLLVGLDFRDDKLHPHKGVYGLLDTQFAGLGGTARDFRIQPDVRAYVPVTKRVTVAVRGSFGFLFPMNYGKTYRTYAPKGGPPEDQLGNWTYDLQTLFFRGFYSGGGTGNRGYPLRGVGPKGPVPLFNPEVAAQQFSAECTTAQTLDEQQRCAYPLGGLSLWEASVELRFPISGPLSGVTFCDTSDVASEPTTLRFNRPHLSCGAGARYDTPVGPIRLDVGYRIPGAQTVGVPAADARDEKFQPVPLFGVFPGAIAFGIGEAF